jgi:selenobiotic family peptide radical SAM maturase
MSLSRAHKLESDIAAIKAAAHKIKKGRSFSLREVSGYEINPTLNVLKVSWKNLPSLIKGESQSVPEPSDEFVLIWLDPETGQIEIKEASDGDLLALKLIIEDISPEEAAAGGNSAIGIPDTAIASAVESGIILSPKSKIRRDPQVFGGNIDEEFLSADVFTLQWHITQACDLHCKHCYDRSDRSPLSFKEGIRILDDFRRFCTSRYVSGHVSFSGGNPFLHPDFKELYRAASERGLGIAILGNPVPAKKIEELLDIQEPSYFQVSLEGLPDHNDIIRGKGHFQRTLEFLKILKGLEIYSMVMLTLTKDNMDQVIQLAEMLSGVADTFNFNRLSMVGEGANLQSPHKEDYKRFLEEYLKAAEDNPIMGLKDNLINIIRHKKGIEPFGGCTGFGCGAAFNFVTLLPDGEVHACRKLPSLIGNINDNTIEEIYESEIARNYRSRPASCRSCNIRALCGGCLAVTYSHGLDIFKDRDPHCFID